MDSISKSDLILKIKQKKDLQGISDSFVEFLLNKKNFQTNLSPKQEKHLIKQIRAELRAFTGRFHKGKGLSSKSKDYSSIINSHQSTKEREDFYPILIQLISELKVKSILDVGCGLNPLAIANQNLTYNAFDINSDEISIINNFFKEKSIPGKAFYYNLLELEKPLPKSDLCLIFKVLDLMDKDGHKQAENIINFIDSEFFLISFPTKTLSGKPMNHPQRGWIERLLLRLGFNVFLAKAKYEIYYLATKKDYPAGVPINIFEPINTK